jgi:transmembrane sensor
VNDATHSTSRLLQAVRETQDQQLRLADAHEHARARARLLQAVSRDAAPLAPAVDGRGPRSIAWRWGAVGLAAAACGLAIMLIPTDNRDELAVVERSPLEFRVDWVEGGVSQLGAGQPLVAGELPRSIVVSDGSRIELAPHGRMIVDAIRPNGATVVLERGEVSLAVHHADDTSWQVTAGPYAVHVTGTQFVVNWEPDEQRFRVAVSEGSVRVEGPEGVLAEALGAGEQLLRPFDTSTDDTLGELAVLGDGDLEPDLEPDLEQTTSGPSKPSKASSPGWDALFADSDYHGAWAALAARPGGIHGEAERAGDAKTMLDLADVARFTKHPSDTRKLLERLRTRYPDSSEAAEAAFALGRLAADGGSQAKAVVWFERYLDERPNGSFVGDALGRLMDCHDALGQTDEAKSAATRYLARHPKGPHAAKAEKILAP